MAGNKQHSCDCAILLPFEIVTLEMGSQTTTLMCQKVIEVSVCYQFVTEWVNFKYSKSDKSTQITHLLQIFTSAAFLLYRNKTS